jgi:endonuclease YncB( thermonuclease family)
LPLRWAALPTRAMVLAFVGGALTLAAALWMALRPSEAPARSPAVDFVTAGPTQVAVVDGATLRLKDRVVRLAGIEPPTRGETCHTTDGTEFDCGVAAANALAALVRDNLVECTVRGHDGNGRPLATCVSQGAALNQTLVAAGWARADRGKPDLLTAEGQARVAGLGLWGPAGWKGDARQ